ncbi:MAG: guanylate kinase [Lachnospiraceae bacterium]|nr:guanylate kinase [Lachnospiraceae bacterium]
MRKKKKKGELLVVSGFSGVGKGTVIRRLMEKHPEYAFSVSATTRAPRPGEVDGKDYYFLTREEFDRWLEEERFLEYAHFFDRSYGTPKEAVEKLRRDGKNVILDIETEGAMNVNKACPESRLVYIIPPSAETLKNRIVGRGTETREQIRRRLEKAVREAETVSAYDYIVVNDSVEETADEIHRLTMGDTETRIPREEALALCAEIREDLLEILKEFEDCDNIKN